MIPSFDFREVADKLRHGTEPTNSDKLRDLILSSYKCGSASICDLLYVYNHNVTKSDRVVVSTLSTLIYDRRRELGRGEHCKDLLRVARIIWDDDAAFSYHEAVVRHGSNRLIRKYVNFEISCTQMDEKILQIVDGYIRFASKISAEHLDRVLNIVSYNSDVDIGESLGYYLSIADDYNPSVASAMMRRFCMKFFVSDVLCTYNEREKSTILERLAQLHNA